MPPAGLIEETWSAMSLPEAGRLAYAGAVAPIRDMPAVFLDADAFAGVPADPVASRDPLARGADLCARGPRRVACEGRWVFSARPPVIDMKLAALVRRGRDALPRGNRESKCLGGESVPRDACNRAIV